MDLLYSFITNHDNYAHNPIDLLFPSFYKRKIVSLKANFR